MEFKQYLVIGALSTSLLTGCGSDSDNVKAPIGASYKGSTAEGTISENSQASFQNTAVEIVKNYSLVANFENFEDVLPIELPTGVSLSGGALAHKDKAILLKEIALNLGKSNANLPVGAEFEFTYESNCTGVSGSAAVTGTMPDSDMSDLEMPVAVAVESIPEVDPVITTVEETYALTITFSNYCYDDSIGSGPELLMSEESDGPYSEPLDTEGMTFNGNISSNATEVLVLSDGRPFDGTFSFTLNVSGFKVTDILSDESVLLDLNITEKYSNSSELESMDLTVITGEFSSAFSSYRECSEELDELGECIDKTEFKGLDGKTYRIDNANYAINGGELSALQGKIFDASFGSINMYAYFFSWCVDDLGQPQLDTGSTISLYGTEEQDALDIRATDCGVFESQILEGGAPR